MLTLAKIRVAAVPFWLTVRSRVRQRTEMVAVKAYILLRGSPFWQPAEGDRITDPKPASIEKSPPRHRLRSRGIFD